MPMKRIPNLIASVILFIALVLLVEVPASADPIPDAAPARSVTFLPLLSRLWVPPAACPPGVHLSSETAPLLVEYRQAPGTVSAFSSIQAEMTFPELNAWQRLIVQPSLQGLQMKAQRAAESGLAYEALVYAPDTRPATPEEEWQNLLGTTQAARDIADQYGKQLILAPGSMLMAENPDNYPLMAALADGWFINTAVYQNANPPGDRYRWDVGTVVNRLRAGNANIAIWAQISLDPQMPDPDTWLAYWTSLRGLVHAADVVANFGSAEEPELLLGAIEELILRTCNLSRS